MKSYDIDWYLVFKGNIPLEFITKLAIRLNMDRLKTDDNTELAYNIRRSLDIMMPVILTTCDMYKIRTYRDNKKNRFVIEVSN